MLPHQRAAATSPSTIARIHQNHHHQGHREFSTMAAVPATSATATATATVPAARERSTLWIGNLFFIKLHRMDFRVFIAATNTAQQVTEQRIRKSFPSFTPIMPVSFRPSIKEGGSFVTFERCPEFFTKPLSPENGTETAENNAGNAPTTTTTTTTTPTTSSTLITLSDGSMMDLGQIRDWRERFRDRRVSEIANFFLNHKRFRILSTKEINAFTVKGTSFVEDITHVYPSSLIRVELYNPTKNMDLTTEDLFKQFRKYGRIVDIRIDYPGPNKRPTGFITFQYIEDAVAAKCCLHGSRYPIPEDYNEDTKYDQEAPHILISYEMFEPINALKNFFLKHPRIAIVVMAALGTLITFFLFDPLRALFIRYKIGGVFHAAKELDIDILYRPDDERLLRGLLDDLPKSIILLTGPQGSGKRVLLDLVLDGRRNIVKIDCNKLRVQQSLIGTSDNSSELIQEFLNSLAASIGFHPSFRAQTELGNWADSIIPGSKGVFTSAPSSQLRMLLDCLTRAITHISHSYPKSSDGNNAKTDYAVVAIHGFFDALPDSAKDKNIQQLLDMVLKWAVGISRRQNFAHVVFVSDDYHAEEFLKKQPGVREGRVDNISINNIPTPHALEYVQNSLAKNNIKLVQEDLLDAVMTVGGRFNDLRSLANKVKRGLTVDEALKQMTEEVKFDILKGGFGVDKIDANVDKDFLQRVAWTYKQLWESIRILLEEPDCSTLADRLLFGVFEGDTRPLQALVTANILAIERPFPSHPDHVHNKHLRQQQTHSGQSPSFGRVTAFSPLYCTAFKSMANDQELTLKLKMAISKFELASSTKRLHEIEDELVKLKSLESVRTWLPTGSHDDATMAVQQRFLALHRQMKKYNAAIERLEQQVEQFKAGQLITNSVLSTNSTTTASASKK